MAAGMLEAMSAWCVTPLLCSCLLVLICISVFGWFQSHRAKRSCSVKTGSKSSPNHRPVRTPVTSSSIGKPSCQHEAAGVDASVWCCCVRPQKFHDEKYVKAKHCAPNGVFRFQGHRPESQREEGREPCGFRFAKDPLPEAWRRSFLKSLTSEEQSRLTALRERVRDLEEGLNAEFSFRMDDVTLYRYLTARAWSVVDAERQLRRTFEWERTVGARHALMQWDPTPHLEMRPYWKPFGALGLDRDGDPVLWERLGRFDIDSIMQIPMELLLRDEIYRRETLFGIFDEVAQMQDRPVHKFTLVEDLSGLSHRHLRFYPRFTRIVRAYEDHCPEVLKRVIVVNAPSAVATMWTVFKTVLDEGTSKKMAFASKKKSLACLLDHIPAESIPAYLGGLATDSNGDPECREIISPGGPIPSNVIDKLRVWQPDLETRMGNWGESCTF